MGDKDKGFDAALKAETKEKLSAPFFEEGARWGRAQTLAEVGKLIDGEIREAREIRRNADSPELKEQTEAVKDILNRIKRKLKELEK